MAFVYENFDIQVKTSDLHKIERVKDLIGLVGNEKFA
jgi:acyl carrier protein